MAYILPGVVIETSLFLLFPEFGHYVPLGNYAVLLGVAILLSLLSGIVGLLLEPGLTNFWCSIHQESEFNARSNLYERSATLLTYLQLKQKDSKYIDALSGEFVLTFNTTLFLLPISFASMVTPQTDCEPLWYPIPGSVILIVSFIAILWICPRLKKQVLDCLETMDTVLRNDNSDSAEEIKQRIDSKNGKE